MCLAPGVGNPFGAMPMVPRETDTQATAFQNCRFYITQGLTCRIDSPTDRMAHLLALVGTASALTNITGTSGGPGRVRQAAVSKEVYFAR
jgi:hypothetical protein